MSNSFLSVRELQESDIELIANYWLGADQVFLQGMGVDTTKMPARNEWKEMLTDQINTPPDQKKSYCIIWQVAGKPVGHCNVNKIIFGQEAYMHLHLWQPDVRNKGYGVPFIKLTLPYFFQNLKL